MPERRLKKRHIVPGMTPIAFTLVKDFTRDSAHLPFATTSSFHLSAPNMPSPIQGSKTPRGIESDVEDSPSDGYILYIVGGIMMSLMYFIAGLSFYTKVTIRKRMAPDDCELRATFHYKLLVQR